MITEQLFFGGHAILGGAGSPYWRVCPGYLSMRNLQTLAKWPIF